MKESFALEIKNLFFGYKKDQILLNNINFFLKQGEFACLLGKSGSGKSSLLSLILGEMLPLEGNIKIFDKIMSSSKNWVSIEKRNIGIVLQELCLFPYLTVEKNIVFGLFKWKKQQRNHQVSKMLEMIEMTHFKDRYPHELSGGQKQRVSLARALAPKPSILLLDEPFSNLDESLRIKLCKDVKLILKEMNMTVLMVTHNEKEAYMFADHVGVLKNKKITWNST